MLDNVQTTIDTAMEDDAARGVFRVGRSIFTDPALFELEMKHIFEGNWIYMAHESQIPNNNDYFTTHMGRQPVFIALRETIRTFAIPVEPFGNLLIAFEQDQRVPKYDTFDQLLGYCANSANPVGHLVLYLFECFDQRRAALSNETCTGLQLANFWQDVARDFEKGRIYLPGEDRERFGVTEEQLRASRFDGSFRDLLRFEVDRTRAYFERGRALLPLLPRKARVDVELFAAGGEAVLRAIEKQNYDVLTSRPRIGKAQKAKLLGRALLGQLFG